MRTQELLLGSLTLLALGAVGRGGDDLGYELVHYAVVEKTFEEDTALIVESAEMTVQGNPMPQELPDIELNTRRSIAFADEYLEIDEGRLTLLNRSFGELEKSTEFNFSGLVEESHGAKSSSELSEATVAFHWDADREAYEPSFEEGDTGSREHLAGLRMEADFRGFLPDGPVEVDQAWDVAAEELLEILQPGGDLWMMPYDLGEETYTDVDQRDMAAATMVSIGDGIDSLSGSITVTYRGNEERDGVQVGVLRLEVDVQAEGDRIERLEAMDEVMDISGTFRGLLLDWGLEGDGELLWNLELGRAHGAELNLDVQLSAELVFEESMGDASIEVVGAYGLTGTSKLKADFASE